jgi:hypothetical protein
VVRTPNLGTVFYAPKNTPTDPNEIGRFLDAELQAISQAVNALALGHLDKANIAPVKPREGDIRFADGTAWNPGSGIGIYAYYGAAWHFLG